MATLIGYVVLNSKTAIGNGNKMNNLIEIYIGSWMNRDFFRLHEMNPNVVYDSWVDFTRDHQKAVDDYEWNAYQDLLVYGYVPLKIEGVVCTIFKGK